MRALSLCLIVLILVFPAFAKVVGVLPDLLKPRTISVDDTQLYVTEGATIFIYSLPDLKLVNKFGQAGQGPQEFQVNEQIPLTVDTRTEHLIAVSLGKISFFKKNGDFIREVKAKSIAIFLTPFNDRFLGMSFTQDKGVNYRTTNLYDGELNKIKELCRAKHTFQGPGNGLDVLGKTVSYAGYKGKILLPGDDEATIDIFDGEMKKLYSITLDRPRLKVDQKFKDDVVEYLKTDPSTSQIFEILKPIRFPEYFPPIARFFAVDDTIYVMTWKKENDVNEFLTYDLDGKFRKRLLIPLQYQTSLVPFPITIHDNHLYQIVENEDEDWEFHVNQIE